MDDQAVHNSAVEMYETAPCGYMSIGADGIILRVNQTLLDWTGYSREELLSNKRLQDLLTVPGKIFYETQYAPLLQMQGFVKEVGLDFLCKGRQPLPVLVNATRQDATETSPALIHIALFDATGRRRYEKDLLHARRGLQEEVQKRTAELEAEVMERKRAEENLRELTSKLLQLRDDERRKLARELHDSVGQMLVALGMNFAILEAESSKLSPLASAAMAENARWLNEISSEIRTISHLLHPPLLDEVGLRSALTWYVDGLATRAGMKINLELPPDLRRLPDEQELTIFRVVQECLTNVHRHSGSKTAVVRVSLTDENVHVEVQDHGAGMSPEKLKELNSVGSGVGIRGMRERIRQLGGSHDISSTPHGTLVAAAFPRSKS